MKQRMHIDIFAALSALIVPWLLYSIVSGVLCFFIRYSQPGKVCFIVASCALIPLIFGAVAAQLRICRKSGEAVNPTWFVILFVSSSLALISGVMMGSSIYESNSRPYYEWLNLNLYTSVDPQMSTGRSVLDAGRMVFTSESRLEQNFSLGFRNVNTYCVAPVVSSTQPLASYDFWATGVNCCGDAVINAALRGGSMDSGPAFNCGKDVSATGGGGLRVLDNSLIPYFRLAVEQAKSKYRINANYPVFFTYVQDPVGEMNRYAHYALKNYLFATLLFFGFQTFLVGSVLVLASRRFA